MIARPALARPRVSRLAATCDPAGLHVLAYAAGFTLWHYRTEAALEAVAQLGYFNAAQALLRPGDRIAVNVQRAGRFAAARDFCVLASLRSEVRLAPLTGAVGP